LDLLFTASDQISFWSISNQQSTQPIRTIKVHKDQVTGLSLHPSGDFLLSCSRDRTWGFSDVTTGTCLYHSKAGASPYSCVSFHPDGLIFGTGSENGEIQIWDVKNQQQATSFSVHTGKVTEISFSENGYFMASSSLDGTVRFWDLRKLKNIATVEVTGGATGVQFDHSGSYVAVSAQNGEVSVYQAKVWKLVTTLKGKSANGVKWGGKSASLLSSVGSDGTLRLYE
jgi:pre-mRNA-processing factor 19